VTTEFLQPTAAIDSDHSSVVEFARHNTAGGDDARDSAVRLYYAVRDGFRYDPYDVDLTVDGIMASTTLAKGHGWCVPKAVLLAAGCRAIGIPARLGFADVRNHLSTERMRERMKTDIFYWHGYTSILLDGTWFKVTPAFNVELCEKFRLKPLEFDGTGDALFHPLDLAGNRHMDYINYRGEFADAPIDEIAETFRSEYAEALKENGANFDDDVERETTKD